MVTETDKVGVWGIGGEAKGEEARYNRSIKQVCFYCRYGTHRIWGGPNGIVYSKCNKGIALVKLTEVPDDVPKIQTKPLPGKFSCCYWEARPQYRGRDHEDPDQGSRQWCSYCAEFSDNGGIVWCLGCKNYGCP